ncbi:chromosomal replication initiator protein DnaA [Nocardia farcinica]|uniref:hypothetical protein n=1 Tax=Nocardia farcinica TaxID=37329 RepID=UPI0018952C71|nr:hypothetical protein [Nocardia farcinica]MBF6068257.1 hypothetical protein [Nocardia farcinica]
MTRDLPFDDDTEVTEPGGDTAYKVASGVARVARAGAYVTGGALVASHGGGMPTEPGEQRLDSWNAGWAHNSDPDPDVPSPVVTFPDPEPTFEPYTPGTPGGPAPVAQHTPGAPAPGFGITVGAPPAAERSDSSGYGEYPEYHEYWRHSGTDAGYGIDPGYGGSAPEGSAPTDGGGENPFVRPEFGPGADDPSDWWQQPGGFGLPGHGLGQAGPGFGMPGAGGFLPPGSNPLLSKVPVAEETDGATDAASGAVRLGADTNPATPTNPYTGSDVYSGFDGVGEGFGVYLETDAYAQVWAKFDVDLEMGPKGVYLTTDLRVEASAGLTVKAAAGTDVGAQIDNFSQWLDSSRPGGGRLNEQQHGAGQAGGASGAASPLGAAAPAPVHAPAAPIAPAVAATPIAPVAPVAVAPVAPVAPAPAPAAPAAAAAAPVVATPLQTTIQPEAATRPIADVFGGGSGPSPLTVPAADVPALLDLPGRHHTPAPTTPEPGTPRPTDVVPGTTAPSVPTLTPAVPTPSLPLPTPGTTLPTDVVTTPSLPDTDIVTKTPGATVTQVPTPDDDITTPGTGTGGGTSGGGTAPTTPSAPSVSVPQPTVSAPGAPTASLPAQTPPTQSVPTLDVPTGATVPPTVDVPTLPSAAVPTPVAPVKPPVPLDPKPKPISDDGGSLYHYAAYTAPADHATLAHGLGTGLWSDSGVADVHPTAGPDAVLF